MTTDNDTHRYDDIIDLPHYTSKSHPRMSPYDRAAQFSPFAALTGHEAAIKETARLTEGKVELDEDEKTRLNEKLQIIRNVTDMEAEITITCFVPDEKKSGGSYVSYSGCVKRMDMHTQTIVLTDGTVIPISYIRDIESELFSEYEYII